MNVPLRPGTHGRSQYVVGAPLPVVMVLAELADVMGFSDRHTRLLQAQGELEFLEVKPRVGKTRRYSGKKVQDWIDGVEQAPRYFSSARRAAGR